MIATHRSRRLSLAALTVLVPGLHAATAAADPPPQPPPVTTALVAHRLVWQYVQPSPVLSERVCDAAGNCVRPFSFSGGQPSVGDVAGTAVQAGAGTMLPDGAIYANSTIRFTGTIRGCGTGSVAMRSTGLNRGRCHVRRDRIRRQQRQRRPRRDPRYRHHRQRPRRPNRW